MGKDSDNYRRVRLESLLSAPESFGSSYEEESKILKLRMQLNIEKESSDYFMFGAFADEELVGICGFVKESQRKIRHKGVIVQMFVKAEFQGQGIGEGLLRSIIRYVFSNPEMEQLTLGVVTDNKKAIRLYEKIGFTEYGLHQKYFKKNGLYYDQKLMILYKENFNWSGK
jgi:RimJ/RimL family protein N-acetyltransferase